MNKRLILELTDKEAGEIRSIISAYLDAGGVPADCGNTPDARAGNRALNRVIEKIDAARNVATTKKVLLLSKREARLYSHAADNSLTDPDFMRDFYDTEKERKDVLDVADRINRIEHGD